MIVRRHDAVNPREQPQRRRQGQEVGAESRRLDLSFEDAEAALDGFERGVGED